ncbi:uncharacterized protein BX663DRAFT_553452 [Cokeromyces recurvatus]|uniref:uncharacterized protein n=1 Tax=Cokeromyces recurvatus TaxID=90255 RepID=UPI00221FB696|nr:uncharacterized protein BX663DRAFT_553452 [Cokeromyces recurvatus]KAI7901219.1 hypothetical protein BX663DRAFT_553452 [Cokeromyces recurvatus]
MDEYKRRIPYLFRLNQHVIVLSSNLLGTVRYLELDIKGAGKNNRYLQGIQYFTCPLNTGLFVLASKLKPVEEKEETKSNKSLLQPTRRRGNRKVVTRTITKESIQQDLSETTAITTHLTRRNKSTQKHSSSSSSSSLLANKEETHYIKKKIKKKPIPLRRKQFSSDNNSSLLQQRLNSCNNNNNNLHEKEESFNNSTRITTEGQQVR